MTLKDFSNLREGDVIYYLFSRRDSGRTHKSYWVVVKVGLQQLKAPYYSHNIEFIWSDDNLTPLTQIGVAHDFPCWSFHTGL